MNQESSSIFPVKNSFYHVLRQLGKTVMVYLDYMGGASYLAYQSVGFAIKGRFHFRTVIEQFYLLGVKSLSLTNLVAIFTGMVLALQFIVGLRRFGLELYTGQIVGIAICRELGPVLTAIMVAARVGSGIASELGSMVVSEQVLAISAMGANPIIKLVVPRVLVTTLITPFLTVIADVIGILGGMVVTVLETGVGSQFYIDQILKTVQMDDFFSGIAKTVFFGFMIGVIACYQGLITTRGTQGVGLSTTRSVVIASVSVFIADYFLTKLFILF